jgi:hypothetical protein|tara:strand:- start:13809 stop:14171 length:363 start_codon:yes stop_codon:yes gene_type:complete
MTKSRSDLGFGNELEAFDPKEWGPTATSLQKERPSQSHTRQAATAAGFRSREAPDPSMAPKPRRRRTGRNAQFNIKAKPETIEAFCAIADRMGWGIGETLEHAVELLELEHGAASPSGKK